jgi:crotonobetainyl-CoA:carnitine CoA-transferase CaiB-like acyl-CoA transferase
MRPLEGLRILAIEQYGAGPFGSLQLADLGADVIKIEDPTSRGDVARYVPPFQEGEDSLFYQTFNRNKRSISLDLRSTAGREVFHSLVATADAVYSNLRGDVPERLGLTYRHLSSINPEVVCVSLSGFGMSGEAASQPGYDYIFQATTGWMSLTGAPDGPPTKSGLSLVDFSGGLVAALALLAAVHGARRDGIGMDCDISWRAVAASMLTYEATWALNGNWEPGRHARSAHPSLVPFQAFAGNDGRWFVIACAKEKFWVLLAECLGDPRLKDPRFNGFAGRKQHRTDLILLLDEIFATRPASHWVDTLERSGVPVGPVRTVSECLEDMKSRDSDLIVEVDHEKFGRIQMIRSPICIGPDPAINHRAPQRNEHGREILADLGYSDPDIAALTSQGAFG